MIKSLVYNHLVEMKLLDTKENHAENSIEICSDKEIVISGNTLGLVELADYIISVALSNVDYFHLHLDESNFFNNTDLELIILKDKR